MKILIRKDVAEEIEKSCKYIKRWFSNGKWHYKYPAEYQTKSNRTETKISIAKKTPLISGIKPLSHATEQQIDEALVNLSLYARAGKLKCPALGNHSVYITGRTQEHIKETKGTIRTFNEMQHKAKYIPFIPEILKNGRICEKSSSSKGVIYGIIGQIEYFDEGKQKTVKESVELAINYDKETRKYVFSFANFIIKKSIPSSMDFKSTSFLACPVGACKAEAFSTTNINVYPIEDDVKKIINKSIKQKGRKTMIVVRLDSEIAKSIKDRSKLVRVQRQVIRNGKPVMTFVWINPNKLQPKKKTRKAAESDIDKKYMEAIRKGDIDTVRKMVYEKAEKNGFKNAIPEQAEGYTLRVKAPPKKTKTIYKTFYVDTHGKPSALFIGNSENLPMNVWIDAKEAFHFTDAKNGREYVPSVSNPNNSKANKTGDTHYFPAEMKDELIARGYITNRTGIKNGMGAITALAYRPGWHAGDLPFFPQGGTKIKGSNYDNVHRWNQVVFEIEIDADNDYTDEAKQSGIEKRKTDKYANDDLQYMPKNGFYQFTTNPTVKQQTGGKGDWFITHSIKIKRAMTEEECNKILTQNGMKAQEWESKDSPGTIGKMDLSSLGYTGPDFDAARKTLAPITYDDDGKIIPLSQRFNRKSDDVRKSLGW